MSRYNADLALAAAERPKGRDKTPRIKAADLAKYKTEEQIQVEVADWLDRNLPADWRWFHPPNGGWRKKSTAARLKGMGVKAGVADVVVCRPSGPDIWIELKAFGGVLSPAQVKWRDWCKSAGRPYFVARSVGEVMIGLKEYLHRRRAA
jgi:VRR-NUC domain